MKSSTKYTQEGAVNDNDFNDYQNLPAAVPQKEKNQNQRTKRAQPEHQYQNVNNSEEILINNAYDMYSHEGNIFNSMKSPETNANRYPGQQDFELVCNCAIKDVVFSPKARLKQQHCSSSEQNVILSSRSCCSTPKLEENRTFSQFSLDRRHAQSKHQTPAVKHSYVCDQTSSGVRRHPSLKRIQSPEIINTHLGPNNFLYDGYGPENCAIKSYGYDKDLKNDDYGFRRGPSFRRASERSDPTQPRQKKRVAGDGMDSEMDDPELMFEPTDHLRACRCPCDHVIYSPGYSCLQIVGPANVKILSIKLCPGVESKVSLNLNITDYNETAQLLSGNFYFPFLVDNDFKISLRGMKFDDGQWIPEKTYINNKTLCRIVDNYIWEMSDKTATKLRSDSICPIVGGMYQIQEFSPNFDRIELPAEMFGHVKFLLQISTQEEVYVCQELEFENSMKHRELA